MSNIMDDPRFAEMAREVAKQCGLKDDEAVVSLWREADVLKWEITGLIAKKADTLGKLAEMAIGGPEGTGPAMMRAVMMALAGATYELIHAALAPPGNRPEDVIAAARAEMSPALALHAHMVGIRERNKEREATNAPG